MRGKVILCRAGTWRLAAGPLRSARSGEEGEEREVEDVPVPVRGDCDLACQSAVSRRLEALAPLPSRAVRIDERRLDPERAAELAVGHCDAAFPDCPNFGLGVDFNPTRLAVDFVA